jgi:hypothetical protein
MLENVCLFLFRFAKFAVIDWIHWIDWNERTQSKKHRMTVYVL